MFTLGVTKPLWSGTPAANKMFCVGPTLGPHLMAEIGDVRRFHSKKALVAFSGIDAPPYQSGQINIRSHSISKRGSPSLRRTLFLVISVYLLNVLLDEPVYQFMDKKRSESKPYRVYMIASANKISPHLLRLCGSVFGLIRRSITSPSDLGPPPFQS